MTQRQKGIRLEREPEGSCKVLFPEGRGRHCWKSDETGRFVRPPRGRPGYILLSCGKELNQLTNGRTFSTRGLRSARALRASGAQVINLSSPLPVACGHAALLFRTTCFGGAPSDAKCGRQPLSNGENDVVGTTALCEVGRRAFFYGKIEPVCGVLD